MEKPATMLIVLLIAVILLSDNFLENTSEPDNRIAELEENNSEKEGQIIMTTFVAWHKKNIEWWKKKLNVSNYGIAWIAFVKGLIIGLLIYHFFL